MRQMIVILALILLAGCASQESRNDGPMLRMVYFTDGEVKNGTLSIEMCTINEKTMEAKLIPVPKSAGWRGSNFTDCRYPEVPVSWQHNGEYMKATLANVEEIKRFYLVISCPHNTKYEHLVVVYGRVTATDCHYVKPLYATPNCHCYEATSGWLARR